MLHPQFYIDRPQPSDAQIEKHQNFDALLALYHQELAPDPEPFPREFRISPPLPPIPQIEKHQNFEQLLEMYRLEAQPAQDASPIHILIDRPIPTETEILAHRDFPNLLKKTSDTQTTVSRYYLWRFLSGIAACVIIGMFAKSYLTQSESSADTKNTSLENPVVAISPALDSSQKQTPAIIQAPSISPTKPPQSTHADNVLIAPPQTNATVAERQLEESKPKTKKHPFDLDSAFAAIGETPMPLPPHKTTKKTIGIQLDNADNYPELRHIKGYQWEYVGTPENDPWENKVFNPENSWNNASITKINGELYEMTLTRDNGERKSFTVRPVLKGAAYEDALKLYEKNKEEYEKKQLLKAEILARWKAETAE